MASLKFNLTIKSNLPYLFLASIAPTLAIITTLLLNTFKKPLDLNSQYFAKCFSGECWLKENGDYYLKRLEINKDIPVHEDDQIVTLGSHSEFILTDNKNKSEIILKNTGIIRVGRGRDELLISDDPDNKEATPNTSNNPINSLNKIEPQNLIYFGGQALNVFNPKPNSKILTDKFPLKSALSISSEEAIEELRMHLFTRIKTGWKILKSNILLSKQVIKNQSQFFTHFEINEAGTYGFGPINEHRPSFTFEVLTQNQENLEGELKNLIQGLKEGKKDSIEIRSK